MKRGSDGNAIPDDWEEKFKGKCDLCGKPKRLAEVKPGIQFGWRVGYVCYECSPAPYKPKVVFESLDCVGNDSCKVTSTEIKP